MGGGWISRLHLEALERLGRTELVGVVAGSRETAASVTARFGGTAYDALDLMLDTAQPDCVYVAVPPHRAVEIGQRLAARRFPFLTEKPLAADDPDGPQRLAAEIERARLVVAVGYHLRALDIMPGVRERLAAAPPQMVVARWLDATPPPAWWGRAAEGGGQVIEQATHLYDLARFLMGEATVMGAASTRDPRLVAVGRRRRRQHGRGPEVRARRCRVIREYAAGGVGRHRDGVRIGRSLDDADQATRSRTGRLARDVRQRDGDPRRSSAERDPYEIQAAAFLDAVKAGDPRLVLSTYADALRTDRLTRAVVAATGAPG